MHRNKTVWEEFSAGTQQGRTIITSFCVTALVYLPFPPAEYNPIDNFCWLYGFLVALLAADDSQYRRCNIANLLTFIHQQNKNVNCEI